MSDPRVALLPDTHVLAGREVIARSELAGESFPLWPGLTPDATAYWTGTDLEEHDWRPGPVVHDAAQYLGSIRAPCRRGQWRLIRIEQDDRRALLRAETTVFHDSAQPTSRPGWARIPRLGRTSHASNGPPAAKTRAANRSPMRRWVAVSG